MMILNVNHFWLRMAGAGIFLILLFWVALVPKISRRSSLNAELRIKVRELETAKAGTPSRADIEGWSKYKAELIQSQSRISTFFADNNKTFHRWFPDLAKAPDGDPPRDAFVARYMDEAKTLENMLTQGAQRVVVGGTEEDKGPGFNWEDLRIEHWDLIGRNEERIVLRELQKRFWARQRVANLSISGRVNVKRIVDFRFFQRLQEKFPEEGASQRGIPPTQWPGVSFEAAPGMPRQFPEMVLPNNMGRLFTFGFAVEVPYSEVTKAIREILSPGSKASTREGLLVNLIGTHVTILGQNPPRVSFNYDQNNDEERKAKEKEILKNVRPRNVLLAITCQILDFDPNRIGELSSK